MKRHLVHAGIQFITVFASGLAVYQGIPKSLDQVWQPFLQALVSALTIWGSLRMVTYGTTRRSTDPVRSTFLWRRGVR